MGIVYEAWDPLLERLVALKTIQLASPGSPRELLAYEERFFAEARIAARLVHPGIVTVHDVGRAATGELFIAFERLFGRTLAELLAAGAPLDWKEVLRITARVAEALHYAHARGVVHRDVKPANVMMLETGEPKVLDFGIAKTDTARIQLTISGQSIGTPLYSSPEQALGLAVDARSDLFSLGVVAYSLLTGRAAFGAGSLTGVLTRIVHETPAPPSSLVPDVPPAVDALLARALAKSPSDRYPDGASFAEDVEDVLAARPPRHAGGSPAAVPAGLDLDAQFAALLESPPAAAAEAASAETAPPVPAPPPAAQASRPAAHGGPAPRRLGRRAVLGGGLAALAFALAAAGLWLRSSPRPSTAPGRADAAPAGGAQSGKAATAAAPSPDAQAWLQLELESLPRGSSVRVFVDRALVAELPALERGVDETAGRRPAARPEAIAVAPGGHDVEVELVREGRRSTDRVWGEFRPGARRRLRARFGGLLKKRLALEWQR